MSSNTTASKLEVQIGGQTLSMAKNNLQNLRLTSTRRGFNPFRLRVVTESEWGIWEKIPQDPEMDIKLRLHLDGDSSSKTSPWLTFRCSELKLAYDANLLYIDLQGLDKAYPLKETAREVAYKDKLISEIVSDIAGKHKLKTDIEETVGKYHLLQAGMKDIDFIENVLLPKARSGQRSEFYFGVKNGDTLVFKSNKPEDSGLKFVYGVSGTASSSQVIQKLVVSYERFNLVNLDCLSTKVVGYDIFKKKMIDFTVDDSKADMQKYASNQPKAPEDPSSIFISTGPHPKDYDKMDIEGAARSVWGRNCQYLFRMTLSPMPNPEIEVGKTVDLDIRNSKGEPHFTTGKWLIDRVDHVIADAKLATYVSVVRRQWQ